MIRLRSFDMTSQYIYIYTHIYIYTNIHILHCVIQCQMYPNPTPAFILPVEGLRKWRRVLRPLSLLQNLGHRTSKLNSQPASQPTQPTSQGWQASKQASKMATNQPTNCRPQPRATTKPTQSHTPERAFYKRIATVYRSMGKTDHPLHMIHFVRSLLS